MSIYRYIHDRLRFEELFNQTCRIIIICRHFVSVYTVSMKLNIRIYDSNIAVINFIINVCTLSWLWMYKSLPNKKRPMYVLNTHDWK